MKREVLLFGNPLRNGWKPCEWRISFRGMNRHDNGFKGVELFCERFAIAEVFNHPQGESNGGKNES